MPNNNQVADNKKEDFTYQVMLGTPKVSVRVISVNFQEPWHADHFIASGEMTTVFQMYSDEYEGKIVPSHLAISIDAEPYMLMNLSDPAGTGRATHIGADIQMM